MANPPKIKLFQLVQKFYQTMGINSSNALNWRNLFFSLTILLHFFGLIGFFLFKSTSISEYGSCFFGCIADLYALIDFKLTQWRMPQIFKLIGMCESFIEKSKWMHVLLIRWKSLELKEKIEIMQDHGKLQSKSQLCIRNWIRKSNVSPNGLTL